MKNQDYNNQLYNKMRAEQDSYRNWILCQPPEEILKHTYEYTVREDIVVCMEDLELDAEQAKALLRSTCPLSDVFHEFRDRETGHMEELRDSIETEAGNSLQRQKKAGISAVLQRLWKLLLDNL